MASASDLRRLALALPEEVAGVAGSHTGEWLRTVLPDWDAPSGAKRASHSGKTAVASVRTRKRAKAS